MELMLAVLESTFSGLTVKIGMNTNFINREYFFSGLSDSFLKVV
jgi:hypothetical protein